ncbi:hypothetical protein PORY_001460 [Pneumocystis oryctolagi]|uniref:Uncharacterized protein n=1 Tax=Pneumocystis oryctolagi TaxID=42067 RepID=A0ACB7CE09_9ASCO|nr:hypothetical protein PORY_001460 [Pneumocystis oryctolagi]
MRHSKSKKEDIDETVKESSVDEKTSTESENEDEIYAVEKILDHRMNSVSFFAFKLQIGFSILEKMNIVFCVGCKDLIDQYWESIGGRPVFSEKPTSSRKRRSTQSNKSTNSEFEIKHRKSTIKSKELSTDASPTKTWKPPMHLSSWEDQIESVDTIERDASGKLLVYVNWCDSWGKIRSR